MIILAIGLTDSDGRDVCRALRANGVSAPVLLLTARDGVHDKIAGFESGADYCLTRPFGDAGGGTCTITSAGWGCYTHGRLVHGRGRLSLNRPVLQLGVSPLLLAAPA